MSVSGRAGAGGGGPHHGPLPQMVEAMVLCGSGYGKQIRASFAGLSFAAPKVLQLPPPPEE